MIKRYLILGCTFLFALLASCNKTDKPSKNTFPTKINSQLIKSQLPYLIPFELYKSANSEDIEQERKKFLEEVKNYESAMKRTLFDYSYTITKKENGKDVIYVFDYFGYKNLSFDIIPAVIYGCTQRIVGAKESYTLLFTICYVKDKASFINHLKSFGFRPAKISLKDKAYENTFIQPEEDIVINPVHGVGLQEVAENLLGLQYPGIKYHMFSVNFAYSGD